MKNIAPVIIVMIAILAFVSVVNAQTKVYNPNLPTHLVFQWKIKTDEVHASWNNDDMYVTRGPNGLEIFYGQYRTLDQALSSLPELPEGVNRSDVSLMPFFNRSSVSPVMAFALLGNLNEFDRLGMEIERESVSFTVYFETFDQPTSMSSFEVIEEELSFEITSNYNFAYSAGVFRSVDEAKVYAEFLRSRGYQYAEVNKYLNGQKVAMVDEEQFYAYLDWIE
ncbi:MAG: hypothetical protein HN542_00980 [Flavobacteriales bacterium]|jgi:hypothetical protein|nr:hypothetical protein [Flavobacteriales bacterium]MBT3964755.1 hypothetical protein [Flavobacteriales bacterium]MBT4706244.1 hypothetical protein [Flavobacteriales bacterium]MBT4931419.1 hypothetical protein [Flavobacteriales bacterium]MBT5131531.1 hypothetical protein [Flavobacteriales bacterium]